MMIKLLLLAFVSGVLCKQECGISKYFDAGEHPDAGPTQWIVGGTHARPHEYPWQVSLQRNIYFSDQYVHFCGGQIIDDQWILTAAHCVHFKFMIMGMKVLVGEHDHSRPSRNGQWFEVERIIKHEDYDLPSNVNDIALIKLKGRINFSKNVMPVCLPEPSMDFMGMQCVVSGWGAQFEGDESLPEALKYTRLPIIERDECASEYRKVRGTPPITEDMLCAGKPFNYRHDACQGDSGGPLVCKMEDGTHHLAGVVSWGVGCASGLPGVYADVQYQLDWIADNMY